MHGDGGSVMQGEQHVGPLLVGQQVSEQEGRLEQNRPSLPLGSQLELPGRLDDSRRVLSGSGRVPGILQAPQGELDLGSEYLVGLASSSQKVELGHVERPGQGGRVLLEVGPDVAPAGVGDTR